MTETLVFYVAATGAIISALAVVVSKNPLRSALWLIVSLCSIALLYILLNASFVAAMQVLVYAGAVMVLFLFVIMMLNLGPEANARPAYLSVAKFLGTLAAFVLIVQIILRLSHSAINPAAPSVDGSVKNIGQLLLSDYLFGFEAISLLILVAVVGTVVLGLKRLT